MNQIDTTHTRNKRTIDGKFLSQMSLCGKHIKVKEIIFLNKYGNSSILKYIPTGTKTSGMNDIKPRNNFRQ